MEPTRKIVHVALPLELYEKLQKEAKETTRTIPGLIRYISRLYLEKK